MGILSTVISLDTLIWWFNRGIKHLYAVLENRKETKYNKSVTQGCDVNLIQLQNPFFPCDRSSGSLV